MKAEIYWAKHIHTNITTPLSDKGVFCMTCQMHFKAKKNAIQHLESIHSQDTFNGNPCYEIINYIRLSSDAHWHSSETIAKINYGYII